MNEMEGLQAFVDLTYLDPNTAKFSRSPGGFLRLELGDQTYPRVSLFRTFPFSHKDEYVSVRDMDGREIGIIENLTDFPADIVAAFHEELERRYFAPVVTRIKSLKEEFGYAYWEVETDSGPRRFTVRDMQQNLLLLGPEHILIVDVDGNRFDIPDYTKLDPASRKYIEDLL